VLALPIQTVLEEAKGLILHNILDAKKARLLETALLLQSVKAHESGREEEALELQRVALDLAVAFRPLEPMVLPPV
jgi:hypothetical protein